MSNMKLETNDMSNMKLRIIGKRGCDRRTYNMPTIFEVVALIVGDFDVVDYQQSRKHAS